MITVNEQPMELGENTTLGELTAQVKPEADVIIVNGSPMGPETILRDGDVCDLIKKGEIPSARDMELHLKARQGDEHQDILKRSVVGIMGLGGLGSAVAMSLVKMGVGKLIISDYDVVVLSNIHRQQYFIDQVGEKKCAALKKTLGRINPFVAVEPRDTRLSEQSIPEIFSSVDVLIECFDNPVMKAAALRSALKEMNLRGYVGASGVAGYGKGNEITTRMIRPGIYIVGDDESDSRTVGSLTATRVGIAAHHQAHQAVRLLLDLDNHV